MENSTPNEKPASSRLAKGFALLAVAFCVLMFARDLVPAATRPSWAASLPAFPLLAIGISFLVVQTMARQRRSQLLKNLLLAATFLLWGVVELLPANATSRTLDELVIALFVVDLAWTILPRLSDSRNPFE
jgi:hypothetical protein